MKITKNQLARLIAEETQKLLLEFPFEKVKAVGDGVARAASNPKRYNLLQKQIHHLKIDLGRLTKRVDKIESPRKAASKPDLRGSGAGMSTPAGPMSVDEQLGAGRGQQIKALTQRITKLERMVKMMTQRVRAIETNFPGRTDEPTDGSANLEENEDAAIAQQRQIARDAKKARIQRKNDREKATKTAFEYETELMRPDEHWSDMHPRHQAFHGGVSRGQAYRKAKYAKQAAAKKKRPQRQY